MSLKSKFQALYDLFQMSKIKTKLPFKVMSIEETINKILSNNLSVSRYGDGEVFMMADQMNESFQTYNKQIAKKLFEVCHVPLKNHLVCIPDIFENLERYSDKACEWYNYFNKRKKYLYYRYFDNNKLYGNSLITRCYLDFRDKSNSNYYFSLLKKLWNNRNIVFIEGEYSRLGVGNDLFDNAKNIKRILAPATNAYEKYEDIIAEAKKQNKDVLFLIALGATATCLAYDLSKIGYQAIDCGHVDIEYEWMNMGATTKVPIPSKYVNEAGTAGHINSRSTDKKYLSEIIAKII